MYNVFIMLLNEGKVNQIRTYLCIALLALSASVKAATVVEFYHTTLDHYFITADTTEAAAIDNGGAGPGWVRTGYNFETGGTTPVCRFYGSRSPGPNSHFYTVDAGECNYLRLLTTPHIEKRWNYEGISFNSTPSVNGSCSSGATPIYRAYNNGFARGVDSNHRITSSLAAIQEVVARGWINEGVVMCSAATPEPVTTCNTIAYASPYFPVGDYSISNNTWGKGDIPDTAFHQCISGSAIMTNGVQTGISAYVEWDWPTYNYGPHWGSIKSYPEVLYTPGGKDMTPIAFSDVGSLTVTTDVTVETTGLLYGSADILIDMWIDNGPCNTAASCGRHVWPHVAEVGIVLKRFKPLSATVVDTVTINGNAYDVTVNSCSDGTYTWKCVWFESVVAPTKASIPLRQVFDYLVSKGILSQNYALISIELGLEVTDGNGTMIINNFEVTK